MGEEMSPDKQRLQARGRPSFFGAVAAEPPSTVGQPATPETPAEPLCPDHLAECMAPFLRARRWVVAYSGGCDSHVLLHALLHCRANPKPPLAALHVNHGLSPHADRWQQHCQSCCAQLGVQLEVVRVHVEKKRAGFEGAARSARYAAFQRSLAPGDVLLLAHHRDDQMETLLLRLLRGAGVKGLQGMPLSRSLGRGCLARPLLQLPRSSLAAYAQQQRLSWVEDESNHDLSLARNYLRQRVLPLLEERWPGYRHSWAVSMERLVESSALQDALGSADLALARPATLRAGHSVSLPALTQLDPARRNNLLRRWLAGRGLPPPPRSCLEEIGRTLLEARPDSTARIRWADVEMRRYRERLYVFRQAPPPPQSEAGQSWDGRSPLLLEGAGCLSSAPCRGDGLLPGQALRVRYRRGGERCRPAGAGAQRPLKKLLQEWGVPPWLRERLPLIYAGDQLAAVADLWVCEGWRAPPGREGLCLQWQYHAL